MVYALVAVIALIVADGIYSHISSQGRTGFTKAKQALRIIRGVEFRQQSANGAVASAVCPMCNRSTEE